MAGADNRIGIKRHFTVRGRHPYDETEWEIRDSVISDSRTGEIAFEQSGVEVPKDWSMNAANILAQKYFRGTPGAPDREHSFRQVADRVVDTITGWGDVDGYFASNEEREIFRDELKHLVVFQKMMFNSPVWFNIGVPGVPQQAAACFILAVDDDMDSILNWYVEEGNIFKSGSGAGVNLSKLRSSNERLSRGGTASGPVSFMRGADASAGTIKSGGTTRRAAKMVILNANHPDIREFIWCKALEERKARALEAAGFDMDLGGVDTYSLQYQNANNSVRVTDEFMQAVLDDRQWDLTARKTGKVVESVSARELFHEIATAAWECGDPGLQFDTTINRWNTASNTGHINASNPCSEYLHLDNSACDLASINLLKFLNEDGTFDVEGFKQTVKITFIAQDILVGNSDYPTKKIAETAKRFRELGIGYMNLGAMLMALGFPYDSDAGRSIAAAVTALMTGHAYVTSARMAMRLGPFDGFADNAAPMKHVLRMHQEEIEKIEANTLISDILIAARQSWVEAITLADKFGVRNSQASVAAPTGTISFLADCDTTGIEPDLSLVKTKKLVGGGTMSIVNQTIPRALRTLKYSENEVGEIIAYINDRKSIIGAPHIKEEHLPVFACSIGDNAIHYLGHVKMVAAVQPFVSGGISKTVNMPESATVEEIEQLYTDAWRMGVKSISVYRDNCKVTQPLSMTEKALAAALGEVPVPGREAELHRRITELEDALTSKTAPPPTARRRLPRHRHAQTIAFTLPDCDGYITVGEYDDGRPGEIFLRVAKQGSTLSGIMDAFAIAVSLGLQHGVPLSTFVHHYQNMRFEPAGITDDADIRIASSILDFIVRRLALDYLPYEERVELGILSASERFRDNSISDEVPVMPDGDLADSPLSAIAPSSSRDAPFCLTCGNFMQRSGTCYACPTCGATSGCS
jgi:ribonucleoside-diphosphate reductase alpha chain